MPLATLEPPQINQVEHFDRWYRDLGAKFGRDTVGRSRAAFDRYRRDNPNDELEQIAAEKFPDSEFVTVRDVPIFAEHETTDSRGMRVKYGKRELAGIVARCNERILDTMDFAPLSNGHTPTQEMMNAGATMPDVLGYVGPFRLGMIGRKNPRYAIFADEHYHKSDVEKVRRLPRRSPEVWLEEKVEDRILDPIAALGAETPRLDLGMARFRRGGDGREVERYSAISAAPAMPAATNTFIPNHGTGCTKKKPYAAGDNSPGGDGQPQPQGAAPMELSPQAIQEIVGAITATKQWQFLTDLVNQQGGTPGQEPDGDEGPVGGMSGMGDDSGMPAGSPASPPPSAPASAMGSPAAPPAGPSPAPGIPDDTADMDDDEKQQYGALSHDGRQGYMAARKRWKSPSLPGAGMGREAYSRIAADRDAAAAQAKESHEAAEAARARVAELETKLRDTERYSRLGELCREFDFDLDTEFNDTADLTDEQFDRHTDRIKSRYHRRDDVAAHDYFPTEPPARPGRAETPERIAERYARANRIANDRQRRGESITAADALALAIEEEQQ